MEMVLNTHLSHEFQPCINLLFILWLFISFEKQWNDTEAGVHDLWRYLWGLELESTAWENGVCLCHPCHAQSSSPPSPSLAYVCGWGFHLRFHLGEKNLMDRLVCVLSSESVRSPGWTFRAWICSFLLRISHRIDAELEVSILPLTHSCYLAFPVRSKKPGVRNEQRPFKWFLSIFWASCMQNIHPYCIQSIQCYPLVDQSMSLFLSSKILFLWGKGFSGDE